LAIELTSIVNLLDLTFLVLLESCIYFCLSLSYTCSINPIISYKFKVSLYFLFLA